MSAMTTPAAKPLSVPLRVRYSETDQMGTFYNSRALEWFEVARTEWLAATGMRYADMERRGVMLPLVEAHVNYLGRARYDDELTMTVSAAMSGKARLRFEVAIAQADGSGPVAAGWTVHAIVDGNARPIRPPAWFAERIEKGPVDTSR
jgi:acyl-CoA thioester hydrolase